MNQSGQAPDGRLVRLKKQFGREASSFARDMRECFNVEVSEGSRRLALV